MSDFNYQAYLRNNPLLKEEVKEEKLLTESQEVEEVELPSSTLTKTNAEVKNIQTMAQAMLDFFNQVKEKEQVDFESNANMKIVLDKLNKLAKTEKKETEAVAENIDEDKINENRPHPTEVFSDEQLDYIGDMLVTMYEKLGLEKSPGETDVVKADALMDRIEGFFETLNEEKIQEEVPSSKMKVSELKAKIKGDIISLLQEEEEDEVEVEDEIEVDAEEPPMDTADDAGLTTDEQEIQDSLKLAYDNAVAIGDQKLADQIGNSITFFTRTHVVER